MPYPVREATGASIRPAQLKKKPCFFAADYGAAPGASPVQNTEAINRCLKEAASAGGGTAVIPAGTFCVYTILLQSNVNLFLEEGAVLAAARTDIRQGYQTQEGEGGNYCPPEVNPYVGLQDHGHSYFANSLVYGADLENIMIFGKGLFTGGRFDRATGVLEYVLLGGDPQEPDSRKAPGHREEWFGNKGLALVRCKNIVLKDFSVTIGGHFAIIAEGCENLYAEHLLVDTTRDAFDIDCCQNVTLRHTVCNSLTDDGICLKASFGAGRFQPLENVLIEDCTVSGYDAGSVYAGAYTRDKLAAQDRCGPTGRVKLGTESTCGYRLVTVRRVKFDRSRGFALEAVDGSPLRDILMEDCTMDNVSSSPIFLRAGDRGRFPVTGHSCSDRFPAEGDIRLDHPEWVLPAGEDYLCYPAERYTPQYNRTRTVSIDGCSSFEIVDEKEPLRCNPANYTEADGHFYLKTWNHKTRRYETDFSREIPPSALPLYANGVGSARLATVDGVCIRNVRITNADPRYPILLMGLTDSPLKNITLEHIQVEYRGGLSMEQAVEQRQLNTEWKYTQFHAKEQVQNLPWLVNTFFAKNEGLLPRLDWDAQAGGWREDPYNVPELTEAYPEPSNFGILPSYGIFARHVEGLRLTDIRITCRVPDARHACVLDHAADVRIDGLDACCAPGLSPVACITHHYRRHTNLEYVPDQPYFTTSVTGLVCTGSSPSQTPYVTEVEVNAPAPGTPPDSLYPYPTVPCPENGYTFRIPTQDYPLPLTVHRPFLSLEGPVRLAVGQTCIWKLPVRNPATDISPKKDDGQVYNEMTQTNPSVTGAPVTLTLSCGPLPEGAAFDPEKGLLTWTPLPAQAGRCQILFVLDDGLIPERCPVTFLVAKEEPK